MGTLKIAHFADCHLKDDDQFDERERCLSYIVDTCNKEQPDLIICAGDVFDSQYVRLDSQSVKLAFDIFGALADIAPVLVVGGTPTHEGRATEVFSRIRALCLIHVSTVAEQLHFLRYGNQILLHPAEQPAGRPETAATISMVPAFTKQYLKTDADIEAGDAQAAQAVGAMMAGFGAQARRWGFPHILAGHFQVGGALVSDTQVLTGIDIEVSRDMIALAEADLVCLGHIHKAQKIGDNIFYSGSTQSQNWGELDDKGFYIHEIVPGGSQSRFVQTPSLPRTRISFDLTSKGARETCLADDSRRLCGKVRVEIKVFADEVDKVDVEAIKKSYLEMGAASCDVIRIRVPRIQARSEALIKLERLRDRLQERARLIDEAVSAEVLSKADLIERDPENVINSLEKGGQDESSV